MRLIGTAALAWGAGISSLSFAAALPATYSIQLQARASVGTGATTFNLPAGSAFSSATPAINNNRQVTFKALLNGANGNQAIWYGGVSSGALGTGGIAASATDANASLSDPNINNNNIVVYPQTSGSTGNGIYKYTAATNTAALFSNGPLGASSWSSPRINNSGQVGTRVSFSGANAHVSYDTNASTLVHAAEVAADSTSPYSFLFTPSFDDSRNIYSVARRGAAGQTGAAQPDDIRRFAPNGTSTVIVEDRDSNATSPYFQFDNSIGVNDSGSMVTFVSRTTTAAASRTVFLNNGATTLTIAAPGSIVSPGLTITSIDNFAPDVNSVGQVAFRATDSSGAIGVFVGDGVTLQRLATIGTGVATDIGNFNINSFGGSPTINDLGDVAFGGGLGGGGNFIAVAVVVPEPTAFASIAAVGLLLRRRR